MKRRYEKVKEGGSIKGYLLKLTIILTTIGLPVMMSVIGPVILLHSAHHTSTTHRSGATLWTIIQRSATLFNDISMSSRQCSQSLTDRQFWSVHNILIWVWALMYVFIWV